MDSLQPPSIDNQNVNEEEESKEKVRYYEWNEEMTEKAQALITESEKNG